MSELKIHVGSKWWVKKGYGFVLELGDGYMWITFVRPYDERAYIVTDDDIHAMRHKRDLKALWERKHFEAFRSPSENAARDLPIPEAVRR